MKRGNKEQGSDFERSIGPEMQDIERIINRIRDVLVKVDVRVPFDLLRWSRLDGLDRIDPFAVDVNRKAHKIRILLQHFFNFRFPEQTPIVFFEK